MSKGRRRERQAAELYERAGYSMREVSDELGVSISTVHRWLHDSDVEVRGKGYRSSGRDSAVWNEYACLTNNDGYRTWIHRYEGEQSSVKVHRLAAVAWFGFDKVVDKVVHHSNGFKLDNRESNLDVTSPVRHGRVSASVE